LFSGSGEAIAQLWLFIVAPLIGGVLAAAAWRFITPGVLATADTATD
jgi:glycerol uptake facilitator-like aquaporin